MNLQEQLVPYEVLVFVSKIEMGLGMSAAEQGQNQGEARRAS